VSDYIRDGQIHRVLAELKEGESIDAKGLARHLGHPQHFVSLDYRLVGMVESGMAAYEEGSKMWYVAGPKLKEGG
jgi:hypothetical protein